MDILNLPPFMKKSCNLMPGASISYKIPQKPPNWGRFSQRRCRRTPRKIKVCFSVKFENFYTPQYSCPPLVSGRFNTHGKKTEVELFHKRSFLFILMQLKGAVLRAKKKINKMTTKINIALFLKFMVWFILYIYRLLDKYRHVPALIA